MISEDQYIMMFIVNIVFISIIQTVVNCLVYDSFYKICKHIIDILWVSA